MRKLINIVLVTEVISDEMMPFVILLLGTKFSPNETIEKIQKRAIDVELNQGSNVYNKFLSALVNDIESILSDYSKVAKYKILETEHSVVERDSVNRMIQILEMMLMRSKSNDLSWAWEDIKA